MWLALALLSALLLGIYDICKKISLDRNAVIPVLFLNTLFSSLIFLPFIILSCAAPDLLRDSLLYIPHSSLKTHGYIFLKSIIVLSSWISSYFAIKYLPLTIIGPIKATQPVITLIGALLIFGERLNVYQWIGVILSVISFYLLALSGRKEGINFKRDKWIFFLVFSIVMGALSGLYDKFLIRRFDVMTVQVWYNCYQCAIMAIVLLRIWYPVRRKTAAFNWRWSILGISVFLTAADFVYFYALSYPDSMISIISMLRRSSVIVTFIAGALIFREKNLKRKALDLLLMLISMFFLYLGSR
ncbi:MAG: DMT family transporter [Dysgonamonadaceae bacterium]|jgi:transporter family protein|nr:DMT family transporter [Dysgonamonadaceae bacterium]